ncbi:MAG TPA: gluconate 2-dehydrogenase subunit 3 family protein [Allosphingosinicella sp.]|jgi:hypothetical protein
MKPALSPSDQSTPQITRRAAVRWMVAAAATISVLNFDAFGVPGLPTRIGTDPNLRKKIIPWERQLTEVEMKATAALCDVILPADDRGPAATAVGVHEFINEWVSAPYPAQEQDLSIIRDGLAWLDKESMRRFDKVFAELAPEQKTAICDEICFLETARPELQPAATFFTKFRVLAAGGYYTTAEGMRDIGYVGNVALAEFPGPPPEVLRHLGLQA